MQTLDKCRRPHASTAIAVRMRDVMTNASSALLVAMLSFPPTANAQTLPNLKGWGGEAVRSYPDYLGEAPTVMESTCIGYSLAITQPTAECPASGGFRTHITLMNGTLPPGFILHENGRIAGDPIQAGNWLVKLQADPLECGEKKFFGFQQLVDIRVLARTECMNDQLPDRLHPDSVARRRHEVSD